MEFILKSFNTPVRVTKIANLHYFEFTSKYHTNGDFHNFCELLYVDRGTIDVFADNYSGSLTNGQLIIHRPNETHSLSCGDGNAPNVIIIGFECSCPELAPLSKFPVNLSAEQKKMLSEIMKEGMSVYAPPYDLPNTLEMRKRKDYPFGADEMIKLRLEAFLIMLIRDLKHSPQPEHTLGTDGRISEIHKYITEHCLEKIMLDNICFLFGTNKTTLCKEFKNAYGTTVLNYANSLKIKEAKSLLRNGGISVTEISERLGFNSIHYFCRLFKKSTGQSPGEYIETIRSKLNI